MDRLVKEAVEDIFTRIPAGDAHGYFDEFSKLLKDDEVSKRPDALKTFRLLQGVFSMYMTDNPKEPFGPLWVMNGQRSMISGDLSDDDLDLLDEILALGGPPAFRARIADLLWIRKHQLHHCRQAIQSYLDYFDNFTTDHWPTARECALRAARLALSLGRSANEVVTVRESIWKRFMAEVAQSHTDHMRHWPPALAKILIDEFKDINWGELGNQCVTYAQSLSDASSQADCLALSARAFQLAGNDSARKAVHESIGDLWVRDAEKFSTPEGGEGMQMSFRFHNAIDAFRLAGAKEKAELAVKSLQAANRRSIEQMHSFSVEIDLQPFLIKARKQMADKTGKEALDAFIGLYAPQDYGSSRSHAEKEAAAPRISNLFGSNALVDEGNIAATTSGSQGTAPDKVMRELARHYSIARSLGAAVLAEGNRVLMEDTERRWEAAIRDLIAQSSFVPPDRGDFFARALIGAMDGDGMLFVHLIIPQLENAIRQQVDSVGGKTTAMREGVMREVDLNGLLTDNSPADKTAFGILGESLAWEFRMLLIDQYGPNLRNRIAHGLSSVEDCSNSNVIFLCWLTLFALRKFAR